MVMKHWPIHYDNFQYLYRQIQIYINMQQLKRLRNTLAKFNTSQIKPPKVLTCFFPLPIPTEGKLKISESSLPKNSRSSSGEIKELSDT